MQALFQNNHYSIDIQNSEKLHCIDIPIKRSILCDYIVDFDHILTLNPFPPKCC